MNFIVVNRRVWHHLPTNQYDWLYSCTCSPRRSQLLSGLSKSLQQEPLDLRNSVCIHIKAMCQLLLDYDSHHGITPEIQERANLMSDHSYESTTNLFGIQMNDSLIGVSMHDATSIGVLLKQRDSSVKCIPCSSVQCEHARLIKRWPMDDPDIPELLVDFLEQDVSTGYSRNCLVSPVSAMKIPFDLSGCLRRSFLHGPETILPEVKDDEGNVFLALFPPFPAINNDACDLCGSRFGDEDPREEGWLIKTVKLYGKRRIFDCFAPRVVVYDNACNLHSYCLNRDPAFFKDTQFLVDRLHWADHTGCSSTYYISSYPDYDYLNSQIAEQSNSGLKKIKGPLSYMNDENFSRHSNSYLWFKNREILLKENT